MIFVVDETGQYSIDYWAAIFFVAYTIVASIFLLNVCVCYLAIAAMKTRPYL